MFMTLPTGQDLMVHSCLQAVKAYKGAVQADEGHPAAALALVKLHLDKGEVEAGRSVCAQLLTTQPNNVDAQLLMVQLLCTQVSSCSRFDVYSFMILKALCCKYLCVCERVTSGRQLMLIY